MDTASLASLIMGLLSFLGGLMLWYKGSVEKRYAAQRDFGHLKRNYDQLTMGVDELGKDVDTRLDAIDKKLQEISMILQFKLNLPPTDKPPPQKR